VYNSATAISDQISTTYGTSGAPADLVFGIQTFDQSGDDYLIIEAAAKLCTLNTKISSTL